MPDTKATEADAPAIAPEETTTVPVVDDAEARIAALETEKAKVLEEKENYRLAYLKEAEKGSLQDPDAAKMEDVAKRVLAESRLAEITREQDAIIKKTLKENKELKLASLNKPTTTSMAGGGHTESTPVRDTSITPEQMAAFKAKGWDDKDIERYKQNLRKKI